MIEVFVIFTIIYFYLGYRLGKRNNQVYEFRCQLIKDIHKFPDWKWRLEAFNEVPYRKMYLQVWKPLKVESFYKSNAFITATEK